MAGRAKLRKVHQKMVLNEDSKKKEREMKCAVNKVLDYLKIQFKDFDFVIEDRLYLNEILNKKRRQMISNKTSHIRPDGGIIYIKLKGKKLPILISEHKRQGTNDKRTKEGKSKQAMGNAVERFAKNRNTVKYWMETSMRLDILPYVLFAEGCDFEENSSIRDRIFSGNEFGELNKLFIGRDRDGILKASCFVRPESWSNEEMFDILLKTSMESIEYYGKKGLLK